MSISYASVEHYFAIYMVSISLNYRPLAVKFMVCWQASTFGFSIFNLYHKKPKELVLFSSSVNFLIQGLQSSKNLLSSELCNVGMEVVSTNNFQGACYDFSLLS
jgi:hypothetical protein